MPRHRALTRLSYSAAATDAAFDFIEGVLSGTVVCGELARLAVERHVRDLQGAQAGTFPYYFDPTRAQRVFEYFSYLRHWEGEWAGQQLVVSPWQAFVMWCVFGWMQPDGYRRFRIVYNEVARKNGKSTWSGGIGLYMTQADGERGAQVYSVATKMKQARIVHTTAIKMVKAAPALSRHADVFKSNISVPAMDAKYEPLGRDADTEDGLNIHCALIDELHAHKTREMWDVIDTAMGARRQPLTWVITTAGNFVDSEICWEQREYGEAVLRGAITDETFFPFIACPDDDDDWTSEIAWRKGNPNLDVSVYLSDLQIRCQKAQHSPANENDFKRKRVNLWTETETRWLDIGAWNACPEDVIDLEGAHAMAGLDLSNTQDLTAATALFRDPDGVPREKPEYHAIAWAWLPENQLHNRTRKEVELLVPWIDEGWLRLTPGLTVDYGVVRDDLNAARESYLIRQIWYDPHRAAEIVHQLAADGFDMVTHRQGFLSMAMPTQEFEDIVIEKRLHHRGNPLLRWQAMNAAVAMDPAGNKKPEKSAAKGTRRRKIDNIVCGVMATTGWLRADADAPKPSKYKTRGLTVIGGPTNG